MQAIKAHAAWMWCAYPIGTWMRPAISTATITPIKPHLQSCAGRILRAARRHDIRPTQANLAILAAQRPRHRTRSVCAAAAQTSGPALHLPCLQSGLSCHSDGLNEPGVVFHGATPFAQMMDDSPDALCVFQPSLWFETFCLVAAEANCLGIPVAGYNARSALTETAQNGQFLKEPGDEDGHFRQCFGLVENRTAQRSRRHRAFKLSTVLPQWTALLKL